MRHAAKPQFTKPFDIDTFQDGFQDHVPELESPGRSPSSLFIVDGEPNTTLLSPSIRSKASNLSSVPSDDREYYSSPSPSPRFPSDHITEEDDRPATSQTVVGNQSHTASVKPTLHLATSHTPRSTETTVTANPPASNGPTPPRRETILDRFFSTAPETPASDTGQPMSSIARFEALMEDLDKRKALQANAGYNNSMPSALIPSPTARVLEFVSTGRRPPTPPRDHHNNWRDASPPPPIPTLPRNIVSPFVVDRRNSDTMSMQSSYTSSTGTTDAGEVRSKLAPPGKRHSLADFSGIKTQQPKIAGGVIEEEEYESDDVEYVDESLREMPEYSYGNMKYRADSEEDRRSRWRDIENHHSDGEEEDDYYDDTSEDEVYYGPQRPISARQRPSTGSHEYHQQLKAPDRPLFREFSF